MLKQNQTSEMLLADQYLSIVQDRGQRKLPLKRVYRNMRRQDLFLHAYGKLYANQGATSIGTDPNDTIQGMSLKRIDRIIDQLRNGTYQWKPSRRVYIPKGNGKKRPLSVPNWSDKLVQEVIRMILEAYYEPQFRDSSHGFRPQCSCHTALWQIKRHWRGTKWFIEGDIKGCFDNIDHDLVIKLLSRNIHDNRFLKLIRDMLQAGYVDNWVYHRSFSGTPQGGVVSPILANTVLHELDCYIEDELIQKHNIGKRKKRNPDYTQFDRKKKAAKQAGDRLLHKQLCRQQRLHPADIPNDPSYRRLKYVRYADDFLLGFVGPKAEAQAIKNEIGQFLERLNLQLSEEKTYITHARTQAAKFLGYLIQTAWNGTKLAKRPDNVKIRSINGQIQLRVPRTVCIKWISRYSKEGKPTHLGAYLHLSDFEIVKNFGAQLRGLVSYYALADNIGTALSLVRGVCMESARKTLASKHKIHQTTLSKRRYYHKGEKQEDKPKEWQHIRVVVNRKDKKPLIAKCGETPLLTKRKTNSTDKLPPMLKGTRSELTTRLVKGECELCGAKAPLEAHHVNKLKNLRKRWQGRKEKPKWVQSMIARSRKTIVVCHSCHQEITHGRYDGPKIE